MAKASKKTGAGRIINRRARYDYELDDSLVAGLQLTGAETKALRLGYGQLRGAYVTLKNGELWLVNAQVNSHKVAPASTEEETRNRKLLLKRSEIERLMGSKHQGRTIVPLEFLTKGRYIKLRIAAGRGKKQHDKRESLKYRQQQRDINRAMHR